MKDLIEKLYYPPLGTRHSRCCVVRPNENPRSRNGTPSNQSTSTTAYEFRKLDDAGFSHIKQGIVV